MNYSAEDPRETENTSCCSTELTERSINIKRHILPPGRIHWGYPQTTVFAATFPKRLHFLLRQLLQLGLGYALGFTCIGFTKTEKYLSFLLVSEFKGGISVNFFPQFFVSEHSIFSVTKIRSNRLTYSNNLKFKPQKETCN